MKPTRAETTPAAPSPPVLATHQPLPLDAVRAWIQTMDRGLDTVQLQVAPQRSPASAAAPAPAPVEPAPPIRLPAACLRRSHLIDTLVEALWQRARQRHGDTQPPAAVYALGSYGRNELCPHSDIDLLVLHADGLPNAELKRWLSDLITPLWDLGLKASQVVSTPQEMQRMLTHLGALSEFDPAASALQKQATSLLDARRVVASTGAPTAGLCREFDLLRQDFLRQHGFSFARHKVRELRDRWSNLHIRPWEIPAPGFLEPNLKEGLGALRDGLAAEWIERALQAGGGAAQERPRGDYAAAHAQLLAARVVLHRVAGHAQDRLLQGLQPEVLERLVVQLQPQLLAEEPLERQHRALAPLYAAMTLLHARAEGGCRAVDRGPRIARRPTMRQRLDREPLDEHWTQVGNELHPTTAGHKALLGAGALAIALHGFELAARDNLRPGDGWLAQLSQSAERRPLTADAAAQAAFRRLLTHPGVLYPLLLQLHRARLLTALIPEFADITFRSQRAPLHEVTVDLHTLRVVGALEHWHLSQRPEDRERVELLNALPRRDLLRLAALLHDIGKSRGDAGHAERGSVMAHDILARLQYSQEDIRLVRILIEEHLSLFNLTTLDANDRAPFERLGARLGSRVDIDRLYLLTIADAQGVALGALPLWREDRLRAMWLALREAAQQPAAAQASPAGPAALRQSLLTDLPATGATVGRRRKQKLAAHLKAMPTRYLTRVNSADALAHLHLIERLGNADAVVDIALPTTPPPAPTPASPRNRRRPATTQPPPTQPPQPTQTIPETPIATPAATLIGKLSLVTRDRPGRFSQICAGITGAGLNVISAEVYERADGIVLNLFRVMPIPALHTGLLPAQAADHLEQTLRQAQALLLQILHNPATAHDVVARIRAHPLLATPRPAAVAAPEATVQLMDASHEPLTIVDVRCPDRAGLLYALTRAMADLGLSIHFATIDTVRGMATDVFYLSEPDGGNLKDSERRRNLRLLLKAVAEHPA